MNGTTRRILVCLAAMLTVPPTEMYADDAPVAEKSTPQARNWADEPILPRFSAPISSGPLAPRKWPPVEPPLTAWSPVQVSNVLRQCQNPTL
jgi:hypothetical protein